MQLTDNFNLLEFHCNDGTPVPSELLDNVCLLAEQLQILRDHLSEPIYINSAYRHRAYNELIGGAPSSQHLLAKAADIRTEKHTPKQIRNKVELLRGKGVLQKGGLGLYRTFVHFDVRGYDAYWEG